MAIELAKAYLPIIPSLGTGFKKNLEKELSLGAPIAEKSGKGIGNKLLSGLKIGAATAGTAIATIGATSLAKGFSRLSSIEQAEAKLSGLGNTAEGTAKIMENALAAVKGTAFGMDEAATTAASAVAAGVKPGQDLQRYLGLVGDAATIAGTDMASMGSIFNKVMTSGKVQGDVFAQLSDQGIPVVQMLAEEMGVAAEEVYAMGSKGQISSNVFIEAMASMEGAAKKGGDTVSGAWKNTGAALSRFGAETLKSIYPLIGPALNGVTSAIDSASKIVSPWVSKTVENATEGARQAVSAFKHAWIYNDGDITSAGFNGWMETLGYRMRQLYDNASETVRKTIDLFQNSTPNDTGIAGFIGRLKENIATLGQWISTTAWPALQSFAELVSRILGSAFHIAGEALAFILPKLASFGSFLLDNKQTIASMALIVGSMVAAFKAVQLAITAVTAVKTAYIAVTTGLRAALFAVQSVMFAVRNATWLMNAAFSANPIGLIVAAVAGLITAFVLAYNNIGWFKDGVNAFLGGVRDVAVAVFEGIKTAVSGLVAWFTDTALPWIQGAISAVGSAMVWLYENVVLPVWEAIRVAIAVVGAILLTIFDGIVWAVNTFLAPVFIWLYESVIAPVWSWIQGAIQAVSAWFSGTLVPFFQVSLALLGAFFTWLYESVIAPVWSWIQGAIQAVSAWFSGTLVPFFQVSLALLGAFFTWLYESVIAPVWSWIQGAIQAVSAWFSGTLVPFFQRTIDNLGGFFRGLYENYIKPAWDAVGGTIKTVWEEIISPAFDKIKTAVTETIPKAFEKAVTYIKTAWEKVQSAVKEPIKWVLDVVLNNGLIKNFNKLADKLNLDAKWTIPEIDLAGWRKGGYTGNIGKDEVAGVVHGQEHVTRAESTARVNREHPGFLDMLNRTGSVSRALGAASGGHQHGAGAHCAHCAASGAAVGHSTTASTAGAPPSGPSGIWGGFQAQISRAGKLFVPKRNFMGVNTENVARAWMGRSAVEIIAGNGSPSVSFATGGAGTYGFNSGSHIWMQNAVPGGLREAVLIHELGHALSLHHTMNTGSIMHPLQAGPTWPSGLDYGSLVRAWGAPGEGVTTYQGGDGGGFDWFGFALGMVTDAVLTPVRNGITAMGEKFGGVPGAFAAGAANKTLDGFSDWIKGILQNKDSDEASMGLKPTLYDRGGLINRGVQLIDHQRSTPDYVLTDTQWDAMLKLAAVASAQQSSGDGVSIGAVYGHDAEEVAAQIEKRRRRQEALALV